MFQLSKFGTPRLAEEWCQARAAAGLLKRYIVALLAASFLSLFYFSAYDSAGASLAPATTDAGAHVSGAPGRATDSAAPGASPEVSPAPVHGAHPPPTYRQLLLKGSVVISISILWFMTFIVANDIKGVWEKDERLRPHLQTVTLARSLMIFGSILPAIPFTMRSTYEPTVFVMALVAIFVAAEHYGGLRESQQELEEKTDGIVTQLARKTKDITDQIGLVLNADGLAEWRAEIYGRYSKAFRRIDAVIRYFDIDETWWRCARSETPWEDYQKLCAHEPDTLLNALDACKANVQFVCDFPMPYRGDQWPSNLQRAQYFRNFMGLAFNLVVFEEVRRRRDLKKRKAQNDKDPASRFFPYARIIISHAPSWMHVIDDVVYQVIERGSAEDATVRLLTQGATDTNARIAMNEWARRNVRQFAHRGARAEEYVCTVLRYQATKKSPVYANACLNAEILRIILMDLGMGDFINMPNGEFRILELGETRRAANERRSSLLIKREDAENACVRIFVELLAQRMSKEVLAVSAPAIQVPKVQDLIYEVM